MAIEADHVVSLGGNCRLAHNLRRHYGFSTAYPFDWWRAPLTAVATLLREPRLDLVFDPDRLEPVVRHGRRVSVRNTFYGLYLRHEFASIDGEIVPDFPAGAARAPARQRFLFGRLDRLNADRNRLLFVRNFVEEDAHVNPREVDDFVAAVRARFHRAHVTLAFVNPVEGIGHRPDVPVLRFDDPAGSSWLGDHSAWDRQLASLNVVYRGARRGAPAERDTLPPTLAKGQDAEDCADDA